jgi:H+/Cl- antiporter ClcA
MLFMGCVTGFLTGVVVTFYNILASIGEGVSTGFYAYIRSHLFLLPLLFVTLAAAAFVIGVVVKLLPMIKGSGIPQTEGAARGELKLRWFSTLCGMFASSLACIFLGLSAGSEGPSIQIGGCCGHASSTLLSRTDMLRRYQITGGACAGLAVAFNAPLTGMAFAFEETHKKFSPEVFICAFSSVVVAVLTRNIIREALGYSTGAAFTEFAFYTDMPYNYYGYVVLTALVAALLGVAFYYLVLWLKKLVKEKVTFCKNTGKMLIPFLLGGMFGILTKYAMGGGHALIEALGTQGGAGNVEIETIFACSVGVTLFIILLVKFIISVINMACGVPCGVFIPMLAIGATAGALMSSLFGQWGMDGKYSDLIVMIGMAAFFTCVVRAPITGIIMVSELTWSFTPLLPVVIGVSIGYMVGEIAKTEPIYDVLLDQFIEEQGLKQNKKKISLVLNVLEDSVADGMQIKEILWPSGTAVREVVREEKSLTPGAELTIRGGDVIRIEAYTNDPVACERELRLLVGERKGAIDRLLRGKSDDK